MDPKNPAIRLFVSDLPETTDAMIPGGVYALIADTPPARFPVLAASLAGAVDRGVTATLLVATPPKTFIDRLTQVGFLAAESALETGRFQVFQLQEDFNKKMFRFGAEAFLNELDHFRLPAQSYLVIDQADELLSLHDISLALEQAEALGHWAKKLKVTVLLIFTRVAAAPTSMATLTGLMDYLSGMVRLGGHQDGLDLTFEYWQSPDSTIAAKVYGLSILEDGRYKIRPEMTPATEPLLAAQMGNESIEPEETADRLRYLYIDSSLASLGTQMQGMWQSCESIMGIIRAAFGAKAPTALLVFERHTVLRDLAEAVHTLRLSLGRRARIVVIERDASLRYQNEILLLRLGTSLVIHRDVQENRIPLMLESLRGQVFNRDIEMHFEAALSSVVTSAKRGYLPPASFVRETAGIVDRSDLLNLPCAMVVATPANRKACTELLTQVRVSRAGDLTSTDGQYCFLFFSGCPESSLKHTLHAVLGDNVDHLFINVQFVTARPDIRKRLVLVSQAVQGKTFPDSILEISAPPSGDTLTDIAPQAKEVTQSPVSVAVPTLLQTSAETSDVALEEPSKEQGSVTEPPAEAQVELIDIDLLLPVEAVTAAPLTTAALELEAPLLGSSPDALIEAATEKPSSIDRPAVDDLAPPQRPPMAPSKMPVRKLRQAVRRVVTIQTVDVQAAFEAVPEDSSRV